MGTLGFDTRLKSRMARRPDAQPSLDAYIIHEPAHNLQYSMICE